MVLLGVGVLVTNPVFGGVLVSKGMSVGEELFIGEWSLVDGGLLVVEGLDCGVVVIVRLLKL